MGTNRERWHEQQTATFAFIIQHKVFVREHKSPRENKSSLTNSSLLVFRHDFLLSARHDGLSVWLDQNRWCLHQVTYPRCTVKFLSSPYTIYVISASVLSLFFPRNLHNYLVLCSLTNESWNWIMRNKIDINLTHRLLLIFISSFSFFSNLRSWITENVEHFRGKLDVFENLVFDL